MLFFCDSSSCSICDLFCFLALFISYCGLPQRIDTTQQLRFASSWLFRGMSGELLRSTRRLWLPCALCNRGPVMHLRRVPLKNFMTFDAFDSTSQGQHAFVAIVLPLKMPQETYTSEVDLLASFPLISAYREGRSQEKPRTGHRTPRCDETHGFGLLGLGTRALGLGPWASGLGPRALCLGL